MEKLQSEGEANADEMDTNLTEAHESMINATEELETLEIEGERNQDGSVKRAHESSIISTTRDPKGEEPFEKLQSEGEVMVDQAQRSNLQTEKKTLEGYEFTSCVQEVEPTYTYGRKKINRTYSRKRKQVSDDCAKQKTLTVMPQAEELKQLKEDEVLRTGHLGKSVEICYGSGKRSYRTEVAGLCCHALQEEKLVRSENFLGGSRKKRHELQSELNTTSLSKNVGVLSHGLQEENLVKSDNDCRGPENRFPKMESGTGYAAIAAGLPPHSLSVEETIRFGSVLKQTFSLENYLKHRNMILDLWQRDIHHALSIADCGINDTASSDDSNEVQLIRDIYSFLNYHGFINVGFVSKKLKKRSEDEIKLESLESQLGECTEVIGSVDPNAVIHSNDSEKKGGTRDKSQKQIADQELDMIKGKKKLNVDTQGTENENAIPKPRKNAGLSGKTSSKIVTFAVKSSDLCGDEESLLDIKNKIKARIRKEKQDMFQKVLSASDVKHSAGKEQIEHIRPIVDENGTFKEIRSDDTEERMGTSDSEAQKGDGDDVGSITLHRDLDNQEKQKKVIIVGAGPAGLAAGRHLQKMGVRVIILEAQKHIGGRTFTDYTSFSGPVDLGASIIKRAEPEFVSGRRSDPTALLCKQLDLELAVLQHDCPVFDFITGIKVPAEIEKKVKLNYGSLIEQTAAVISEHGRQLSIAQGIELALRKQTDQRKSSGFSVNGMLKRCFDVDLVPQKQIAHSNGSEFPVNSLLMDGEEGSPLVKQNIDVHSLAQRVIEWHFANLEYACGEELTNVSLPYYWNHVDVKCGFGGPHCMIKAGFGAVMEGFRDGLEIHMEQVVSAIDYKAEEKKAATGSQVQVRTEEMDVFIADAVLLTVPLGCLKSHRINFSPPLPDWKTASIERLGFGLVNKVVMEFPTTFWDEKVDYFGVTAETSEYRGRCFMFSSLKRTLGLPILSALVAGKAAIEDEQKELELLEYALRVLRKSYGEKTVPQPTAFRVTKWGSDPFSRGAYSYVTVGASEEDYDVLSLPVQNKVFFAGDATCREHPNTVGGAILSGIREAVRIMDGLHGRSDVVSESRIIASSQRQLEMEKEEVRAMLNMLENTTGNGKSFNGAASIKETLVSFKSNSRRLLMAQEMLQLPKSSLRNFLGTKDGLLLLKDWIKGSIETNGMQLLRLCVHLLIVVGTDISSVRQSGIGCIVNDIARMQLSNDIRAGVSQLLELWKEVFDNEKNITKPLKPSSSLRKRRLKQPEDFSVKANTCMPSQEPLCGFSDEMAGRDNEEKEKLSASLVEIKPYSSRTSKKLLSKTNLGNEKKEEKEQKTTPLKTPVRNTNFLPFPGDCLKPTLEKPVQASDFTYTENPATEDVSKKAESVGPTLEQNTEISELESAALAAVEAADVAVKAFQTAEAVKNKPPELPKIVSFQKFAKRENVTESNKRRPLQRETLVFYGKNLITSGSDVRQCKVREWSIDFSDSFCYLGSPGMPAMYDSGASNRDGFSSAISVIPGISSTDTPGEKHESYFTSNKDEPLPISKEITDNGSEGSSMRGSDQRKHGICLASLNSASTPVSTTLSVEVQKVDNKSTSDLLQFSDPDKSGEFVSPSVEKCVDGTLAAVPKSENIDGNHASSNGADDASSMRATSKEISSQRIEESSSCPALLKSEKHGDNSIGIVQLTNLKGGGNKSEDVKQAIMDYVIRLLSPLYKTRRIDKEAFKSMSKKATVKVIERRTEEEVSMGIAEFLDTKRKLKIRSLVDKLVERHLESKEM